jgi:peroxiredoxin Q/BCP
MVAHRFCIAITVFGLACVLLGVDAAAEKQPKIDLQVGDIAPLFTSMDECGNVWKLADHVGRKTVVLYFYRADFTTGCTRQAEAWRDRVNGLAGSVVVVVGVCADSVKNHKLFKQIWELNFTLLADEEAQLPKLYGVPVRRGGKARAHDPDRNPLLDANGERLLPERKATFRRWTFVIDRDGKIAYKNTKVKPAQDNEKVLEFIKQMGAPGQ